MYSPLFVRAFVHLFILSFIYSRLLCFQAETAVAVMTPYKRRCASHTPVTPSSPSLDGVPPALRRKTPHTATGRSVCGAFTLEASRETCPQAMSAAVRLITQGRPTNATQAGSRVRSFHTRVRVSGEFDHSLVAPMHHTCGLSAAVSCAEDDVMTLQSRVEVSGVHQAHFLCANLASFSSVAV